jgi:site-specific DNA recombinase
MPPEIKDLHLATMKKLFEAKEGNREEQFGKLKKEIEQHESNLLKFDHKMYVEETMEADSYKRLKKQALEAMEQAKRQTQELVSMDTAFEKYCRFGMSILTDLDYYFEEASLEVKRKMVGSIFPGKLTFEYGKYRTDGLNPALAIILQKSNRLQNEKTGNIAISENVSGDVPKAGVEPTTFALRMLSGSKHSDRLQQSTTDSQRCFGISFVVEPCRFLCFFVV